MSGIDQLEVLILRVLQKYYPVPLFEGVVDSVDLESETCQVSREDDPELFGVRLHSVEDTLGNKVLMVPKVGSTVICGTLNNVGTEACILKTGEVEYFEFAVQDTTLRVDTEGITFNGGELGGLIKVETLVSNLNKSNELLAAIQEGITNWTPSPGDGGTALKTALTALISDKGVGSFDELENLKVKH